MRATTVVEFPADAPGELHRIEQAGERPAGIQRLHLGQPASPQFGQVTFVRWEEWRAMVKADAYQVVDRFIRHERSMREQVFAQKPKLLREKLADADRALVALAVLAPTPAEEAAEGDVVAAAEQPGLFEGGS